ncbi:unnamed protein product [Heterotrigona itama]|uniref:Uncharacterized protein n=1 Tax=Heterotrigona itama TaxID=395501 RepID=A0A6V7HEM9_9HYME|nr:unnamed protein product [Heterotrigona itama]
MVFELELPRSSVTRDTTAFEGKSDECQKAADHSEMLSISVLDVPSFSQSNQPNSSTPLIQVNPSNISSKKRFDFQVKLVPIYIKHLIYLKITITEKH